MQEILGKYPMLFQTLCICYELEILQEKIYVDVLQPVKSVKIFNLENLGYSQPQLARCPLLRG